MDRMITHFGISSIVPLIPILLCLLAILLNLIRKRRTLGWLLRHLVPAYLLMIMMVTMLLHSGVDFFSYNKIMLGSFFATIILLAVCASAGAFLHNKKTYISGIIAVVVPALFHSLTGLRPSFYYSPVFLICHPIFLLILCVLGLFCDKTVSQKSISDSDTQSHNTQILPKPASDKTTSVHSILCLSGIFAGAEFPLKEGEPITIGSSPLHSQIILSEASIKEAHCKIWFDQEAATWCIMAFSDGETYQNGTQQLIKDHLYQMPHGTILSIGNGSDKQQFKLL